MTGFRLDKGGLIERRQKINFRFNGQQVTGFKGDTIASALMASGPVSYTHLTLPTT